MNTHLLIPHDLPFTSPVVPLPRVLLRVQFLGYLSRLIVRLPLSISQYVVEGMQRVSESLTYRCNWSKLFGY